MCMPVCTHVHVDVLLTPFYVPDTPKWRDATCQSTAQVHPPYMCCAHTVVAEQNPTLALTLTLTLT